MTQEKEEFRISDTLLPGLKREYETPVNADGTLSSMVLRFYLGAKLDLQIKPFIEDASGRDRRPIINLQGKNYIDGENDSWDFDPMEPVRENETVVFVVENTSDNNRFDFAIHFTLEDK